MWNLLWPTNALWKAFSVWLRIIHMKSIARDKFNLCNPLISKFKLGNGRSWMFIYFQAEKFPVIYSHRNVNPQHCDFRFTAILTLKKILCVLFLWNITNNASMFANSDDRSHKRSISHKSSFFERDILSLTTQALSLQGEQPTGSHVSLPWK